MAHDPENLLILETSQGTVVVAMRPELAPRHVDRIRQLVREGFYDGVVFLSLIHISEPTRPY